MDTQEAILWVAGLFEGEGHIQVRNPPLKIRVSMHMTDRDVLERTQDFFGGKIYVTKRRKEHHKKSWLWSIVNNSDAVDFLVAIRPHLLERRAKAADLAIVRYAEWDAKRQQQRRDLLLTHKQIQKMYATGDYTQRELAKKFGCGREHISRVVHKKYKIDAPH
jgi:hypothetical protein